MTATYITFGIYMIFMVGMGLYFYKRTTHGVENFILGGRGMGKWVTALSAQASDMSGWLLMGLPGAIYLAGVGEAWVAIGLLIGTLLNWVFVASRLRVYTALTNSLTLSSFLSNRFGDKNNALRVVSAVATLLFFTIYAASGLNGAGKLFESMFGIKFQYAVIIGSFVMIFYTMLGGFVAVCWTDLVQGILMFFAIIIMPLMAFLYLEDGLVAQACANKNISLKLFPEVRTFNDVVVALMVIISAASWGLGYFGQPHILSRFMSIKHIKLLPHTIIIAMIWVIISLAGAVAIGVLSIPLFPDLASPENEKVFIMMIDKFSSPILSGVLFAAILAAIMSTIDSQLLVSSSTLIEDVYLFFSKRELPESYKLKLNRYAVCLISVVATLLALNGNQTIFGLVKFAWGGLGASFGPAVLAALYWKRASFKGVTVGMIVGMIVLLIWYYAGFGKYMYEIVPGFLANIICIIVISLFSPASKSIQTTFVEFKQALKTQKNEIL